MWWKALAYSGLGYLQQPLFGIFNVILFVGTQWYTFCLDAVACYAHTTVVPTVWYEIWNLKSSAKTVNQLRYTAQEITVAIIRSK